MVKCSALLSDGAHFWFCHCPNMRRKWEELSQDYADSFKAFTANQLGCILPKSEIKIDNNNITFINQRGEINNG